MLGDCALCDEVRGEGPQLLMVACRRANLHGWPGARVAGLEKRHCLVFFDHRGAGRTSGPHGRFRLPQMADDAVALAYPLDVPRSRHDGDPTARLVRRTARCDASELSGREPLTAAPTGSRRSPPYDGNQPVEGLHAWLASGSTAP